MAVVVVREEFFLGGKYYRIRFDDMRGKVPNQKYYTRGV